MENYCPKNRNDWRNWLELNHEELDNIWLIVYKKNSPKRNISWSDAVDEALCFGWIDSVKKTIDSEKYKHYYSKRKSNSMWSKVNKTKVENLIDKGLMTQKGLETIMGAKANGSWSMYDEVDALIVPDDLDNYLAKRKGARDYYEGLSNSKKKIILYWIASAKRTETRERRVLEVAESASECMMPKQFR